MTATALGRLVIRWPALARLGDATRIFSGSIGKLAAQLGLFLVLVNTLTLSQFGVFASVVSLSLILSRASGFGMPFITYRAATARPGALRFMIPATLIWMVLSVPAIFGVAAVVHWFVFASLVRVDSFLMLVFADVFAWRILETVSLVNEGRRRFIFASVLVIGGIVTKLAAALLFHASGLQSLESWAWFYVGANMLSAIATAVIGLPRGRWRVCWATLIGRARQGIGFAVSNIVLAGQSELDKIAVLVLAGDKAVALYAISMRVIDLTALPIRAFNQLLIQEAMRNRNLMHSGRRRLVVEIAILILACAGFAAIGVALSIEPTILGRNVSQAIPVFMPLFAVAAVRNLTEYHAELHYALGMTARLLRLSFVVSAVKLALMCLMLWLVPDPFDWALPMSAVFAVVYLVSTAMTHVAFDTKAREK